MAKITNEEKLEALKKWLKENNVAFRENHITRANLKIDLWIPKLRIAVKVGQDDGTFFNMTHRWCKPFFIRETETMEFVIEKIQNCCFEQMVFMQKQFEKKNAKNNDDDTKRAK